MLDPLELHALNSALDIVAATKSSIARVNDAAVRGTFITFIRERAGGRFLDIGFSYPGSPELGVTSIGCNPRRVFQMEYTTGVLVEVKPTCP